MNVIQFQLNDLHFTFHVVKDMTLPCTVCGVPACGEEVFLWLEDNNKCFTIILERSNIDLLIEDFLTQNNNQIPYQNLPKFIQQYNEQNGWCDWENDQEYTLVIDDFLAAIQLLHTAVPIGKWMSNEELKAIETLALEAQSKACLLKILRN